MRLRFGAVLCLFLVFLGAGCRKALAPNVDNNLAPETWITAAPQDTITDRNPVGVPVPPQPGDLPVRFHLYWAGSDRDGAITGFYWAVVETLPVPPADGFGLPSLPGPKPQDYHYTSRTDSIFIFRASEDVSVREHTFYIYSIDDKGKPDPTPARFMFRAYDRFPPLAIIDTARAVGTIFRLRPGGGVSPELGVYFITDSFDVARPFPRDTVPSVAQLTFKWHGEPTIASTVVTGYRYKLDEPGFNVVDSSVRIATYNTRVGADVISPGLKKFTLRAVGESGWRGETTRYFQMNFAPDEWFSGPDTLDPTWQTYTDGNGKVYRYMDVNWSAFGGIPGTSLSSDSVNYLPASRPERRTFFELYGDRIWVHGEGDTINLNSFIVVPSGGYDQDSPYLVKIGVNPHTPPGIVTTIDPNPNGSPIGFRSSVVTLKIPDPTYIRPTESPTYPVFDLASPFNSENIAFYGAMTSTGTAYVMASAEDADGAVDRRIRKEGGPEVVADNVDSGFGTDAQIAVRPKILKFYVNHAPVVDSCASCPNGFVPRPRSTIHGVNQFFNIVCHDIDPIDPRFEAKPGGPQNPPRPVLYKTVYLIQHVVAGDSIYVQTVCQDFPDQNPNFTPDVTFENGPMTVRVVLSDYRSDAHDNVGGRTVTVDIPVTYSSTAPGGINTGDDTNAAPPTQRPGSTQAIGRRQ